MQKAKIHINVIEHNLKTQLDFTNIKKSITELIKNSMKDKIRLEENKCKLHIIQRPYIWDIYVNMF